MFRSWNTTSLPYSRLDFRDEKLAQIDKYAVESGVDLRTDARPATVDFHTARWMAPVFHTVRWMAPVLHTVRWMAPVCSAAAATAPSRADAASASVKVRSGARNRSAKASDFFPSPTCGPV